ncbi:3868_t:CDS:2 [Funneliformis mosseae]|uniref:3868_t:CDS:1 n=1 Tax=Funneliformis mosseae TaxID=27381 RepID=A0A9N9DN41_FUNMO|nr:3868_t:CDS:2 [Funneliformis mosseae]
MELISVQKDLKYLDLYLDYIDDDSIEAELDDYYYSYSDESDLDYCDKHLDERQSLAKIPNALTKLHIVGKPCCEQLESLDFLCGDDCEDYIMEREFLEMVVEFSPKKFHELKLEMGSYVDIETTFQWVLKTIFKRWANRVPCIPLSLTIITKIAWTIT